MKDQKNNDVDDVQNDIYQELPEAARKSMLESECYKSLLEEIEINLTMNHTNKQGFKHVLNLVDSNNLK